MFLIIIAILLCCCTSQPTGTSLPTSLIPAVDTASPPSPISTHTSLPPEPSEPAATPLPTATPTPAISPTPFTCTDKLGCVQIQPGEPLQLAAILAMSPPYAILGKDSLNGLNLAIQMRGEILGHQIALTTEDDQCQAEVGREIALELAEDPSLVAVIGTNCSVSARSAVPWLSKAGLTVLSPSNTAPDLTEEGNPHQYPGYFRTIPNDQQQGILAARLAVEELGVKTAAAISGMDSYSIDVKEGFTEEFASLGGQIVMDAAVDPGQYNPTSLMASLAAKAPELIYLTVYLPEGGEIIKAARETAGLEKVHIVGNENLFDQNLEEALGFSVEGLIVSRTYFSPTEKYLDSILPVYGAVYNQAPLSYFHPYAMDAALLLFDAIEKVAAVCPDGTVYIPRQALRDALYALENYQGITGELTCSPTGDCGDSRNIFFYQFRVGIPEPEQIWP